ncbi:MAG: hypothetical protein ACRDKS_16735 [Actinomycetota bacterium]
MRRIAFAAALLLALAGCREDFFDPTPGQSGPASTRVEVIAENVQIIAGDDNAVRIAFQPSDVSVQIRVERSSSEGRIVACPLRTIDDSIAETSSCLPDLPDGVRESLTLEGLGAIALIREGDPMTLSIRLEYEEAGRKVTARLPLIARPAGASVCKDNGCNPFLEMTPVRTGPLTATADWTGGSGRLEVAEGRIRARAFSSTGIPYRIADQAAGAQPLSVSANLSAPSEYALALLNASDGDMTAIQNEVTWP